MVRRTNKPWLYLIKVKSRTVAIIAAEGPPEAISKYLTRIGFDTICTYFCSYQMTSTKNRISDFFDDQQHFITTDTKTIDDDLLSISSEQIRNCDDTVSLVDSKGIINNPLFMRPPIEEVRNCIGFRNAPEHKLRKFCI